MSRTERGASTPHKRANALAEHLANRVRAAANALATEVQALTGPIAPTGGYTPITVALRLLLDEVIEQAVAYDLHAGPGLATVAEALGVTERTARARYSSGPRELPLLIALDEG